MKRMVLLVVLLATSWAIFANEPEPIRLADKILFRGVQLKTPNDDVIVFWTDTLSGSTRIMAQSFAPSGTANWANPMPVVSDVMEPEALDACLASDGNYFLLYGVQLGQWINYRVQKISTSGAVLWGVSGTQVSPGGYNNYAPLVADNQGGVYAFWDLHSDMNAINGQHLDATGTIQWGVDGMLVLQHSFMLRIKGAIPDGSGGCIVNISKSLDSGGTVSHLLRLSPTGSVVGNSPLLDPDLFPGSNFTAMPGEPGQFILYNAGPDQVARFLRVNAEGSILAPLVSHTLPPNSLPDVGFTVEKVPSDGLYYLYRTDTPYRFYAAKLDAQLQAAWQDPVAVTPDNGGDYIDMSVDADAAGRLWVAWTYNVYPAPTHEIRAQMVDASGQLAWDPAGMLIASTDYRVDHPAVTAMNNRGYLFWGQIRQGMASLNSQNVSPSGELQWPAGGEPVRECVAGFAGADIVVPMTQHFCILWNDTRRNELGNIYFQLTDTSLIPTLAANGVPLCDSLTIADRLVNALPMPDGSVAVLFYAQSEYTTPGSLYMQQILPDGSKLYPQPGIFIASGTGYDNVSMSIHDGDLYIVWGDTDYNGGNSETVIIGQRIHQGQIEWNGGGRLLVTLPEEFLMELHVRGAYVVWQTMDGSGSNVRALRVQPNGTPSAGWPAYGLDLVSPAGEGIDISGQPVGLADGDLVCVFRRQQQDHYGLFAQRFSPSGQRRWGSNGITLDTEVYSTVSCADFAPETTFGIYRILQNGLWLQRYGSTDTPLLGDAGVFVDVPGDYYDDVLLRYQDGWYSFFRASLTGQNSELILHQVYSPSGVPLYYAPQSINNAPSGNEQLSAARIGNIGCLIWTDNRQGIYDSEYYLSSVYAVRVAADHVDADDPGVGVPALPAISGIGPNPFKTSASIGFTLPRTADVELVIYNIRGQKVASLCEGTAYPAGNHSLRWDGQDLHGKRVASGIYLCLLKADGHVSRRTMVLVK